MTHIIDGHNLIPKIPGMTLRQIDDEKRLSQWLQVYARVRRRDVEVFYDGAPPGNAGTRNFGMIRTIFVPKGQTADNAIKRRLEELGKAAKNVTVVSSDRQVVAEARSRGATVISSEEFAKELIQAQRDDEAQKHPEQSGRTAPQPKRSDDRGNRPKLSPDEVDEWMKLFKDRKK